MIILNRSIIVMLSLKIAFLLSSIYCIFTLLSMRFYFTYFVNRYLMFAVRYLFYSSLLICYFFAYSVLLSSFFFFSSCHILPVFYPFCFHFFIFLRIALFIMITLFMMMLIIINKRINSQHRECINSYNYDHHHRLSCFHTCSNTESTIPIKDTIMIFFEIFFT